MSKRTNNVSCRTAAVHGKGAGQEVQAGAILSLRYLGRHNNGSEEQFPVAVYYLTYRTTADDGCTLAAKLFLPIGRPPDSGWPASVWCHGFGDPATQLQRWPIVGDDWKITRGELAGRWAHHGIATLTPWLPGDGPSQPLGTYSPMSLPRNAQAIADSLSALHNLPNAFHRAQGHLTDSGAVPHVDLNRIILRTDCVSTPLLVYFAAHRQSYPSARGLVTLVADDFQPSIAYNEYYLGPFLCQLPPREAAAMRCIWIRVVWSLAMQNGTSPTELFGEKAVQLLSERISTPVGPLSRIMGLRLVPPRRSQLAVIVEDAITRDLGRSPTGMEIRDWLYSPEMARWASHDRIQDVVEDPFYQRHFAASDPFFPENIQPFQPGLPLLLVGQAGLGAINVRGLPSFNDRYHNMTLPKVQTLRSWGWDIRVLKPTRNQGTSFSGGDAQRWVLDRVMNNDY